MSENKHFSIAIDGPAGAGKSTVAKLVAARLGGVYLDTGAMYRAVGLYMREHGITEPEAIAAAAGEPQVEVRFVDGSQHTLLDGRDITQIIRTHEAGMLASSVAAYPEVRTRLVELQRALAKAHSIVMDGRDIGTHVLPDATLKIFLTASDVVRARRRFAELKNADFEEVLRGIRERDYADSHRAASPMRKAEDAVELDGSDMTAEEVTDAIVKLAAERIG